MVGEGEIKKEGEGRKEDEKAAEEYFCAAAAAVAKSLQSCLTLCDPIDGSPPGSPSLGFSRPEHWSGLPFPSPVHESEKWKWHRSVVSDDSQEPMDCSLPGSYIHGIFQARLLEWGAIVQRKVKKKSPCGHVILLLILTVPRGEPLQPPRRKVLPEYAQKFPFLWLLIQRRQVGIFQSVLTRDSRGRKCSRKYQWYAKVRFPKDGFLFLNIFF